MSGVLEIQTIIWLFPVIFMFHDLEEIITIEWFVEKNKNKAQQFWLAALVLNIKKKLGSKSSQLAVAVAWMLLMISFITLTTANFSESGGSFLLFTAVLNVFFVQVFAHISQTLIFRAYTPGIITAVCLVVPYSLFAYYHLLEADFIDWHMIVESIPFSLLLVPVFLVGNLLGRQFIR